MPIFFVLILASANLALASSPPQFVFHEQNGAFLVDEIRHDAAGWPELRSARRFATEQEAAAYVKSRSPWIQALSEEEAPELLGAGQIWEAKNKWSWEWEIRYSNWIRETVKPDFLAANQIATDCADVAYALRWIFARIHHLPMASRLYSGEWFSEKSLKPEWQNLPTDPDWSKDQRFLAALRYVLRLTYTHSLGDDTYPVAIRPESVLEGSIQLTLYDHSGHTQPFMHVKRGNEPGIPIEILQSTVPRMVRSLAYTGFWTTPQQKKGEGGLVRFRWPSSSGKGLVPAKQMPYFSEEQYAPDFLAHGEPFFLAVYRRIWPSLSLNEIADGLISDTRAAFKARQQIVNEGYEYCLKNDCQPGSEGWDAWSTPNRDQRAGQQLSQIYHLLGVMDAAGRKRVIDFLSEEITQIDGLSVNFDAISWAWNNKTYSVDPRDPPTLRWAISPGGLGEFLRKTARSGWVARNELLAWSSDCPATLCVPGSEEWEKRFPLSQDFKLLNLFALTESYCHLFPAWCPELRAQLTSNFDLLGNLSLEQTLLRFHFINADPRLSAEHRRDGTGRLFRIEMFPPTAEISGSRNFLFSESSRDGNSIRDIRTFPAADVPPPSGHWLALNVETDEGFFADGHTAGIVKLGSGDAERVSLGFTPTAILPGQSGAALVHDKSRWAFIERTPRGIFVTSSGQSDSMVALDADHILYSENNQELIAARGAATPRPIALTAREARSSIQSTDLGWFVHSGTRFSLVLRSDYSVIPLSSAAEEQMHSRSGQTVVVSEGNKARVLQLNHEGAITSERTLTGVKSVGLSFEGEENGQRVAYAASLGEILRIPLYSGELEYLSSMGDLVVVRTAHSAVLRRINESRPLLRAVGTINFYAGEATSQGFVQVCDRIDYNEETIQVISGICRIENFLKPEMYSAFTGVGLGSYSVLTDENPLSRGFSFSKPGKTLWVEYLKP